MNLLSCNTAMQPYPDELLYSFHARLGLHSAIVSPKSLVEALYNDRKVAASTVYPTRIETLVDALDNISSYDLINNHTLFPLTAPFIPEKRKLNCIEKMNSDCGLGLHLASGYAACRIPKLTGIRCCPLCLKAQIEEYGEPYWMRIHQLIGTNVCVIHGCELSFAPDTKKGQYRHTFRPAMSSHKFTQKNVNASGIDRLISRACEQLLSATDLRSPTYTQWTNYYRHLARGIGAVKGAYVDFDKIKEIVSGSWQHSWLKDHHLSITNHQSNWLHNIFRKHRKGFSYLEHIVVNIAFLKDKFDIIECIKCAAMQENSLRKYDSVSSLATTAPELNAYKLAWKTLLEHQTPKGARTLNSALYAKLYRGDRKWLLAINKVHSVKKKPINTRVNWHKRDVDTVKCLFRIMPNIEADLLLPRITKRWLMFQLNNTATIEKYIQKLPLTSAFLDRYSETVSEYQIRRITYQLMTNQHHHIGKRWFLLRASGLSEERMTETTKKFLDEVNKLFPKFSYSLPSIEFLTQSVN
jgi:hypothetical protein